MNKQELINKLVNVVIQDSLDAALQVKFFRFIADLAADGLAETKVYESRFFPSEIKRDIILRDHYTCTYCNRIGTIDFDPDENMWNVDHVIPHSKGGLTTVTNGVLSCSKCNVEKGDMLPAEYIRSLRFNSAKAYKSKQIAPDSTMPLDTDSDCKIDQMDAEKWRLWIEEYAKENQSILENPPSGIRTLARAMSVHITGSKESVNNYVGMASRICKEIRETTA